VGEIQYGFDEIITKLKTPQLAECGSTIFELALHK
jgi:hypothetical protein